MWGRGRSVVVLRLTVLPLALQRVRRDGRDARQTVLPVDVHRAGAADTFATRSAWERTGVLSPADGERVVNGVLDVQQGVQEHVVAPTGVREKLGLLGDVDGIALHVRLDILAGVEAINVEETVASRGLLRCQSCEGPDDAS